jgi:hypothetical protein
MTFANSFYVAPNKIDYKTVFLKFSPLSQAAVIGVLFVIFSTYFIILAWATHRDKTDILKVGICIFFLARFLSIAHTPMTTLGMF